MTRLLLVVVSLLAFVGCGTTAEKPDLRVPQSLPRVEAQTDLGVIRGVQEREVLAFYGVPYAGPVEGLARFLPPTPVKPFNDTFDATDYGQACPQVEGTLPQWMRTEKTERFMAYVGFEEIVAQEKGAGCLNLNLWTQSLTPEEPAPVMVFLHGGGLNQGSSKSAYIQGANLAKKGAVVVNLNYRLGIQGFLAGDRLFEGEVLESNRGIMDVVAALRWVQEHIHHFGGDKSRVTLLGESGGAFAVWAVLSAPSADGLLHRAVIQSAPPYLTPLDDSEKVTKDLLADLDVAPGDVDALAALPNEDIPHTILSEKIAMGGDEYGWLSQTNLPFNGTYGSKFIPRDTLDALKDGRAKDVDLLVGTNKHESRGLTIMVPLPDSLSIQITSGFLAGMIGKTDEDRERVFAAYEKMMPDADALAIREQMVLDAAFRQPVIRAAEIRSEVAGAGKTFVYEFHWESPCCDGEVGAIHTLEIAFAYDNLQHARMLTLDDPTAQPLADAMSDAWVAFAKSGVPAADKLPTWPEYDAQSRATMVFDRQSQVVSDPDRNFRLFWKDEYASW